MSRVLITGGASGLGLALAEAHARRGDEVLVGDLAPQRPSSLLDAVEYVRLDVRSEQDFDAALHRALERWGTLDVLYNNAGIATGGRIDVESLEDWERALDINLLGVVRGCQLVTPVFKRQRSGHIVNIASLAGLVHGPGMASYNAAKTAVVALSHTLRFELSPWGVDVSVACPSFFRTNLHESMAATDPAMAASAVRLITQAPYTAEEIAAAIMAGVDAREAVIVPDEVGRSLVTMMRERPQEYEAWGRRGAARLADPAGPADPAGATGAAAVRDEDSFDTVAVTEWLRTNATEVGGIEGEPRVRQFTGGASNLTYLLSYPQRDLILRRPPAGTKAKGAHDMGREFRIQQALAPVYSLVPTMVGYCSDESVIGTEFYVMERLVGTILRRDIPAGIGLDEASARNMLCANAIDALVKLHAVDLDASGMRQLDRGPGYVERQVGGWVERYARARTEDVGDFAQVSTWLVANQPADRPHTLVHNDFRFDNLVLDPVDPTRIVGVLDWELATVGDPLMDVGSGLAYWCQGDDPAALQQIRLQPTNAPGMWTRQQVWDAYLQARGLTATPQERRFYELFGTFRLAVIAQQIYYRAYHGQTSNPRAKAMGQFVPVLEARCTQLLSEE